MRTKTKLLSAFGALSLATLATPAMAVVPFLVSTNETTFNADRLVTKYNFPTYPSTSASGNVIANPYTINNVTYSTPAVPSSPTPTLMGYNDGGFGAGVNYIGARSVSSTGQNFPGILSIVFNGNVLGLTLGSYTGAQTVSYVANGVAGTLNLPANNATSFLGFDNGGTSSSINVTFNYVGELDVVRFETAVPEPASWALMILGIGAAGGSLRRRRRTTTRVAFA